ncbi:MAG: penicillin-binding protein [Proteobacteria bacterium]|nr:penicillin-binding protein [Pseudomonadota bacterium]
MRWRVGLFVLALLIGFGLVLRRSFQLQVRDGARLKELALQQYLKHIELPARRGPIFDRHGAPLAVSVEVDSVCANPRQVGAAAREVATRLAPLLELGRADLLARLRSRRFFVWLKRRVTPQLAERVRALRIPGVFLQRESRRFYPNGALAGALLGFSGVDGRGLEGVERSLDRSLRGSPLRVRALRDALGRSVLDQALGEGDRQGDQVVLTIDKLIQHEAEQALADAQTQVAPGSGWTAAVVMDPLNGDILALAGTPAFDPNRVAQARARDWRIRALADAFEPGSTLKLFTVLSALVTGVTHERELIDCENGRWRIGRRTIHDHKPHGLLSVADVVKKSSNIGVSKLAFRMGKQRLSEGLRRFGFAQRTGLPLPGERTGVLYDPARWSDVALANIAFGQGMTATVVQLVRALAAIGNGGKLLEPRLVLQTMREGAAATAVPAVRGQQVVDPALARRMLAMMRGVTEDGGTAEAAAVDGYSVAGKTGTAQKVDPVTGTYSTTKWLSSFMGLVPATRPRLAIIVVINEPSGASHYGGEVAGPVFRRIAGQALRHLGVAPDLPVGEALAGRAVGRPTAAPSASAAAIEPPALPQAADEGAIGAGGLELPDFRGLGMAEVLDRARAAGVGVRLVGSGVAVSQRPSKGFAGGPALCQVTLEPPSWRAPRRVAGVSTTLAAGR